MLYRTGYRNIRRLLAYFEIYLVPDHCWKFIIESYLCLLDMGHNQNIVYDINVTHIKVHVLSLISKFTYTQVLIKK